MFAKNIKTGIYMRTVEQVEQNDLFCLTNAETVFSSDRKQSIDFYR